MVDRCVGLVDDTCQSIIYHLSPLPPESRGAALSPSRESALIGDEDEEEEDDEFGGQETLVTARAAKAESEFSQQDTLVIREDQPRVSMVVVIVLLERYTDVQHNN